jgi:hypothetical protein
LILVFLKTWGAYMKKYEYKIVFIGGTGEKAINTLNELG